MGSFLCDVPQPEGALRRLTMVLALGLVAVLRIVPPGDNVAFGEMVQRVLSASLPPVRSSVEEKLEESLREGHPFGPVRSGDRLSQSRAAWL